MSDSLPMHRRLVDAPHASSLAPHPSVDVADAKALRRCHALDETLVLPSSVNSSAGRTSTPARRLVLASDAPSERRGSKLLFIVKIALYLTKQFRRLVTHSQH
jgi:hypothetical protein